MTVFGIILIILSIAFLLFRGQLRKTDRHGDVVQEAPPQMFGFVGIVVGAFLAVFSGLFFYAEAGYSYLVQYPTGTQYVTVEPGPHLKFWGQVIEMKQVLTVKCNANPNDDNDSTAACGAIEVRFNDAVLAKIDLAARFRLPTDEVHLKKLMLDYRSQENLLNSSLLPVVMEGVRNSARLLSAQEFIVGKGGEFELAVLDQLEKGIYILESETIQEGPDEEEIKKDATRTIDRTQHTKIVVKKKVDKNGDPLRKQHPFTDYGVLVTQATVEHVDPEDKFKQTLGQQRDAAAQTAVEKQKAMKAEFEKMRVIAEGETAKSEIRVQQEKLQVEKQIAAETEKKVRVMDAEAARDVAQLAKAKSQAELEAARLDAQRTEVLARAEADRKRLLQVSNGSLEAKLAAWENVNTAYADALKSQPIVPSIVIGAGGAGTNAAGLMDMLMAKTAKDLALDMKVK